MAKSRALTVYLLKAISSEPDAFIKSDLRRRFGKRDGRSGQ